MISTNLHQQTMKSIIMVSYFLLLVLFINIFVVATDDDYVPVYFDSNCTISRNFTSNSPYQFTLASLFVSLSSHLDANTYFYNTTQPIQNTNDTVFVLFMCRRDVPSHVCHDCVQRAATRIARLCPNNKEAIIWYEECMLRYSDRSFFSTLQKHPNTGILFPFNVSNMDKQVLEDTVNDLVEEAAKSKFAIKEANLTETTLYSLAQCTQDLSTQDCHICLRHIIRRLWSRNATVYGNRSGNSFILGLLFNPTCNFMFGPQRFYYKHNVIPITPLRDVQGLEDDRQYLYKYSCPSNKSFTANSDYQSNQRKVLYTLVSYSNATGNMGFYNTTVSGRNPSDTVYGLFMCRGDVSPQICHQCVSNASELLSSECQFSKEAIVWYLSCLLRYSNHSFFSILELDLDPSLKYIYTWDFIHKEQNDFNQQLATTLSKLVEEATDSGLAVEGAKKFAMEDVSSDTMWGMFYTLAQCTPDLSTQDCRKCLTNIVEEIKLCCLGKQSGIFMYPSCNMLFSSSYRFYYKNNTISETPAPTPTHNVSGLATKGKEKGQSRTIIIVVVVVLIVLLTLFGSAYYILRRKRSKRYKALLEENFGSESASLESLQFSLDTIEAATNKFSHENRIGKGGFGEVYKGVLSDGREIAVKRLSKSSGQGVIEFKNEILFIAKLQHRNLVALLGFCLEEQEKILVYEFVPNKSLDYFLFGSQKNRVLHWLERSKIIGGIARGVLYIHEHSRLKVIHRDLKPSNILLDDEMNPKISDFGLAKMIAISETEGNTNRIVGTYGYMSPEYAMLGQFSEKLDVFSFGVIVLEIVSGKRNANCHHGSQHIHGLLSYAWKQWRGGNWSDILDSDLIELESYNNEVVRCIQIGLLCVQENPVARPSMNTVVQYLSNDSIQLPSPQKPAFFLHGQMEPTNGECAANDCSGSCSINEMSMSNYFFPR